MRWGKNCLLQFLPRRIWLGRKSPWKEGKCQWIFKMCQIVLFAPPSKSINVNPILMVLMMVMAEAKILLERGRVLPGFPVLEKWSLFVCLFVLLITQGVSCLYSKQSKVIPLLPIIKDLGFLSWSFPWGNATHFTCKRSLTLFPLPCGCRDSSNQCKEILMFWMLLLLWVRLTCPLAGSLQFLITHTKQSISV